MKRAAIVAGFALAGCAAEEEPLERCLFGDRDASAMLEIVHLDRDSNIVATLPNAEVPLHTPEQGGWILLLGARATNIDGCQLELTTSSRDVGGDSVIKLDQRPARLKDDGDGWAISSASTLGNLGVCREATAGRDRDGQPLVVTVAIEDLDGRRASREMTVVPVCPDDDPRCACECARDYVLGATCPLPGT
jgi:hypothetical protein